MLAAVAHDPVLPQAKIEIRDRSAWPGREVDVDARLRDAEQREAVRESRGGIPERRSAAIAVEETPRRILLFGHDRRREPGRLVIRDPQCVVDTVDDMEGDRCDVLRIAGPFVSEPLVEGPDAAHSGRGRCAAYLETVFRADGEQRRQEHDGTPVDEGEVETIADTEAIETRSGDRNETLVRRPAVHVENTAALRVSERAYTVQCR